MSDALVNLARNSTARAVVKTLGLPIPMPRTLERAEGPWEERPLKDRDIVVMHPAGATLADAVAATLAEAGANPVVAGGELDAYVAPGEAHGRPPRSTDIDETEGEGKPYGLVLDASHLRTPEDLRALYDFFHPRMSALAGCGRLVVLGRPADQGGDPAQSAAREALEGFVRSAGREVGRRGATATLVIVEEGAEDRLAPVLRFVLTCRSAFVSGQSIRLSGHTAAQERRWVRPLEGKVALVTGAARGIGAETARRLAMEGAQVVVLDRPEDEELGAAVAEEIGGSFLGLDVAGADAAATLADRLKSDFGGVDVVVHNAGITRDKTLGRMSPEWWDLTIGVNLTALIDLTAGLTDGALRDGGRVICLSSIAGIAGNVGQTNYAASKAGVIGYVRALAPTLAGRGITVNAIAPGFIETRLTEAIPAMTREAARRMSNLVQGGVPQDIAEVVTFLASPGADGVTGEVLRVCGGHITGR
ncbi:MAG: 3-oxoacyl-ACP reductase [Myxococcota bacterium]|nr:3-oxoacyl-ACP reductase [Myxococcota bacterium]